MPTSTRTRHIQFYDTSKQNGHAQRADRGVRPYRTLCDLADGVCGYAIARCRVDVGIDPYGNVTRSPLVVLVCLSILRGRGKPRPYVTTKWGGGTKNTARCELAAGGFLFLRNPAIRS